MEKKKNTLTLVLFLLGIFMGAIDNGIVSPAREIIQKDLNVTMSTGMWMITIYTLSYAVSMPIVSKMADRYGHKKVYTFGIAVFALGSMLCGFANIHGSFSVFLASRVIQAIGAGGIIPIATSVIGQSFPQEKRGMALGLVGAVYGVATIIGPTLGSGILSIAGNENWGWLFFINVPISVAILLLSSAIVTKKAPEPRKLDLLGALLVAASVGSLMYALTNINFFKLGDTLSSVKVYPFLIAFVLLLPALIFVEGKAEDPVLNLKYFKNKQMLLVMILAFLVGVGLMGMVFVPQFAENILKIKAGTGGYMVTLLAVFSGISSPLSGKMIDQKGARFVMILGFMFTMLGLLVLAYIATASLSFISIFIGLALMGFGVGFTMGAPLNYLVLKMANENEGASALATMSLIRSIGVAVSPNLMIGFIVDAGSNLGPKIMGLMPKGLAMPTGGTGEGEMFKSLQNEDVTTIVDAMKNIIKKMLPPQAQEMVLATIEKTRGTIEEVFQSTINSGYAKMFTMAAIIAAIGCIASLLLKNNREAVGAGSKVEA